MPTFITYAWYSHSGIKGLVDKPSDRAEVIKGLIEKAGGKFTALYMTTGANDVVLIFEAPAGSDAVPIGRSGAARGGGVAGAESRGSGVGWSVRAAGVRYRRASASAWHAARQRARHVRLAGVSTRPARSSAATAGPTWTLAPSQ